MSPNPIVETATNIQYAARRYSAHHEARPGPPSPSQPSSADDGSSVARTASFASHDAQKSPRLA